MHTVPTNLRWWYRDVGRGAIPCCSSYLSSDVASVRIFPVLYQSIHFHCVIILPSLRFFFRIDLFFVVRSLKSTNVVTFLFRLLRRGVSTFTTEFSSGSSSSYQFSSDPLPVLHGPLLLCTCPHQANSIPHVLRRNWILDGHILELFLTQSICLFFVSIAGYGLFLFWCSWNS